MERNHRVLHQDSLEADIEVGDFQVIPRPEELIKSHLRSSGAKVKKSKEKSASKEFSAKKESKSKSSIKEKSSKSMSKSRLKAAEKKQREKELDKKFELFLHSAKHAMCKHSSKSETSSKMSNLESDKQKSSAESGENVAEDQHLKIMEEPAFTAQERLKVLNARDNFIRLNIKSEETERKKVTGSCPDMCPEKERYSRIAKNCLSVLEMKVALDPK
ncbi:germinal-center associated nuclear protein-like, partial [Stegodyphus dumicola]|uniref:germinal-center associated nuclear protein-like n=1 Tax=Stegodyphus dumicola TaxID=202533 RepID=UPI0015B1E069